jgi:hypothetical protein
MMSYARQAFSNVTQLKDLLEKGKARISEVLSNPKDGTEALKQDVIDQYELGKAQIESFVSSAFDRLSDKEKNVISEISKLSTDLTSMIPSLFSAAESDPILQGL